MEQLTDQLNQISDLWDAVRDPLIANQAAWAGLPENAPEMVASTIATLKGLVGKVSETTRRGKALRLSEAAAAVHLAQARATLTQIQLGQYNQFQSLCSQVAHAASGIYGIYILASSDGADDLKEACLKAHVDLEELTLLHEKLRGVENHADGLAGRLEELVSEAEQHVTSCADFDARAAENLATIQEHCEQAQQAATDATSHEETISELAEDAEKLRADIASSIQQSDAATEKLDELSNRAVSVREELERLLPWATSATLATAYTKAKGKIEERMTVQFRLFAAGLFGLVVTIGVGHYVLGPFPTQPVELMVQLLTRGLMASPAIWFTWVCVRQYTYLSRLHTDYGFKESVTTSFEGFRHMMEDLDQAEHKELTSLLSADAIRVVGSDPDRLGHRHNGDDSPISHFFGGLVDRVVGKVGKSSGTTNSD